MIRTAVCFALVCTAGAAQGQTLVNWSGDVYGGDARTTAPLTRMALTWSEGPCTYQPATAVEIMPTPGYDVTYDAGNQPAQGALMVPAQNMKSVFVYLARPDEPNQTSAIGSFNFDADILGIITDPLTLSNTDGAFAPAFVPTHTGRGLEWAGGAASGDTMTVYGNKRNLDFGINVHVFGLPVTYSDEIRILLKCTP